MSEVCDQDNRLHRPGYLYLMSCSDDELIKVGHSVHPQIRAKQIEVGPRALSFTERRDVRVEWEIGIYCMRCGEDKAHDLLSDYPRDGEWFNAPLDVCRSVLGRTLAIQAALMNIPEPPKADKSPVVGIGIRMMKSQHEELRRIAYEYRKTLNGLLVEGIEHIVKKYPSKEQSRKEAMNER